MIATHNNQTPEDSPLNLPNTARKLDENEFALSKLRAVDAPQLFPSRIVTHHPKAGLNPLVDASAYLFSILGKLKGLESYRQF